MLQRGQEGGNFRRNSRERDVRRNAREPVGEEQRRDPEERGRGQAFHHQPEGCGEVRQIRGHGPEPSLQPGEPQVNTADLGAVMSLLDVLLSVRSAITTR